MPIKSFLRELQDMKGGLGTISRRSFDVKFPYYHRSRSLSSVFVEAVQMGVLAESDQQSCWASMPPELLRDVLQRVEASESTWPARKNVVACACVCRNWRDIVRELVKTPEQCGKLTFPISLKQPGPRDDTVQCFIKRDRTNSTYHLYLGLSSRFSDIPTAFGSLALVENGKFLLAARKVRRATSSDYIISLNRDDMSRGSTTYVGNLRSNFLGTKFTVYDSQAPHNGAIASTNKAGRRVGFKQVSPRLPAGSYNVAHIAYELNVLGTRGPRRMLCTLHSIPASALEAGGVAPTPMDFPSVVLDDSLFSLPSFGSRTSRSDLSAADVEALRGVSKEAPLMLKNKAPRWHEQLQCWCLNFRGRVTVASVKNFQLVASLNESPTESPRQSASQSDNVKVLLQFGKVGKDTFTMDYHYPLSAFQAFAICLSSFDTKLACE